jgi:DNA-directed RNA polymerase specialized sigma24 family protein
MPNTLSQLAKAWGAKRRADEQYRAALLAAVDDGVSYAELARRMGISRQAVRQFVDRLRSRLRVAAIRSQSDGRHT